MQRIRRKEKIIKPQSRTFPTDTRFNIRDKSRILKAIHSVAHECHVTLRNSYSTYCNVEVTSPVTKIRHIKVVVSCMLYKKTVDS